MANWVSGKSIVLLSALALSACSGTWEDDGLRNARTTAPGAAKAAAPVAAKSADQVQLFPGSTAAKPFTVIQDISVAVNKTTAFNADPTVAQVEARLKASAAALGGDAVTNVVISDVRIGVMSWGVRTGKGTVVKY